MKGPAAGFWFPARFHGAANVSFQSIAIDVRPLDPAAFAKGVFQNQLAVVFIRTLDRQAQADMVAMGIPDLLAFQAPAQRIAVHSQQTTQFPFSTFGHEFEAVRREEFCDLGRSVARSVRIAREHGRRTQGAKGPRPYRAIVVAVVAGGIAVPALRPWAAVRSSGAPP